LAAAIEAGEGPEGAMVSVRVVVAVCGGEPASVTLKVSGTLVAVTVGVPPICPAEPSFNPVGSAPEISVQVRGGVPPVAVSVWEYGEFTWPPASAVVRMLSPAPTVMAAVVSGKAGKALAWIIVDPAPTPVMGTLTLVALAEKVTVAGIAATAALAELKFTVNALGRGAAIVSVRFCAAPWESVRLVGKKLKLSATCTA
jgi:hypothetical protein